ncbi:MAG: alkene reductase, partial [Bradyrhizobium sp.]|nr:alkene reductase [Bradyrhizobium sp.]
MKFPHLFSPVQIGPYQLKHRVVLAPLTRMRASKPSLAPRPLNAEYYAQRSTSGGLLIAEASPVSATAFGAPAVPGIYTEEQIAGWRKVVDAVHARGGVIFLQLWHVGRVSHSSFQPGGALPVAPSAIAISQELKTSTADGKVVAYETPRALETSEIPGIVEAFRQAAKNALAAGFDGVEVHGANGYLLEQFIRPNSNIRTDKYGGSIENRARFVIEVAEATAAAIGKDKVGIRLSPYGVFNDMPLYPEMEADYTYLAGKLNEVGLVYVHLVDHSPQGAPEVPASIKRTFRNKFKRTLILSGGYDAKSAEADLATGKADLIAVGRPILSNPDLIERWKSDAA